MKKIKESLKIDKYYFLILIISLFLMLPLINDLYFEGHDTGYHIANILAISDNLSYHNIFNLKIFSTIANNFGYGAGIFYPQLSHVIAAFFYKILLPLNISVFTSLKLTNFVIIFLSGIFMYRFIKLVTKNNKISFISTLFYLTMPYKIYDYLVRDAIAESFVFVFIPIIFLSIYYLFNKQYKKFYVNFIIGYVGLINSHLVMTIYTTLILFIVLISQTNKFWNKEVIKKCFISTIIVLLICLPFIIPLLTHKLNGSYVVFDNNSMANSFGVYGNGLNIFHYFIGWPINIGYHFLNYIALYLVLYLLKKLIKEKKLRKKIKDDYLFATGFICTILGIWMSSLLFPWFLMPNFLLMIQFPWRLGTFTSFGIVILCYYALLEMKSAQRRRTIKLSVISCILIALFCMFCQSYKELTINDYNLSELGMGWQSEYLPINAKKNKEYLNNRGEDIVVIAGIAEVTNIVSDIPYLKFNVESESQVVLELPRLYYLGYEIKASYDGKEEIISYIENKNGFIEINLEKSAIIEVNYTGTKETKIGTIISLITIIGFGIFIIFKKGEYNG